MIGHERELEGYIYIGVAWPDEIDDGECEEIRGVRACDFYPIQKIEEYLATLAKKLAHGGKLIVGGTDYISVFETNNKTTGTVNDAVFNTGGAQVKGLYTLDDITKILDQLGLQITRKELGEVRYLVEAVRP